MNLRKSPSVAGPSSVRPCDAATDPPRTEISLAQPRYAMLTNVTLRDSSVMQSFAYDDLNQVWIFAQVQQSGRFGKTASQHAHDGDLTLTKVSESGAILGYMYLNGFGHGLSISAEPVGTTTYVWTESNSMYFEAMGSADANGYGTKIARFAWRNSATYTSSSSGVTTYGVNGGAPEQSPCVDYRRNRIAVQDWSTRLNMFRWSIYPLDQFKAGDYTPIIRSSWPAQLNEITDQGWAYVNDSMMLNYNGDAYSATNPAPGNATLFKVSLPGSRAVIADSTLVISAGSLSPREPEGLAILGPDNVCVGFTSGPPGARRANIYCQHGH
jgi:hypothetical protein